MCRLAFTVATDAPISQAKVVASIANVEEQVKAVARRNSEMQQQLQGRLDIQIGTAQVDSDPLPKSPNAERADVSMLDVSTFPADRPLLRQLKYHLCSLLHSF